MAVKLKGPAGPIHKAQSAVMMAVKLKGPAGPIHKAQSAYGSNLRGQPVPSTKHEVLMAVT